MDKPEFLSRVQTTRAAWEAALAAVPAGMLEKPASIGDWAVKDLVVHITWSEREMVGILRTRTFTGSPLWDLSNDERNQVVYRENKDRPLADVLAEADRVWQELWSLLQAISEQDLNDPAAFPGMPAELPPWRILAGSTYIHYQEHTETLSKVK